MKKHVSALLCIVLGLAIGTFIGFRMYEYTAGVLRRGKDSAAETARGAGNGGARGARRPAESSVRGLEGANFGEALDALLFTGHPLTVIDDRMVADDPATDRFYYGEGPVPPLSASSIRKELERACGQEGKEYALVVFSSVLCPFCGDLYPYLRKFASEFGDRVEIMIVNDAPSDAEDAHNKMQYIQDNNLHKAETGDFVRFRFLAAGVDEIVKMGRLLSLERIPQMFLIDASGLIIYRSEEQDLQKIFAYENGTEGGRLEKLLQSIQSSALVETPQM